MPFELRVDYLSYVAGGTLRWAALPAPHMPSPTYIAVPPPLHPPPVRVPIYTDRCNNKHTSRNRKHASRRLDERLG